MNRGDRREAIFASYDNGRPKGMALKSYDRTLRETGDLTLPYEDMKIQRTSILEIMLFSLLLIFCLPASAYYDPGVQRWINRDPLQEGGGDNLSRFCDNDPLNGIDSYGETTTLGSGVYGDCTKKQHHDLHDAASKACKASGRMRCDKSDDCDTIKEKLGKFDACMNAKQLLNDTCFSGESSILNYEVKNYRTGRQNCADLFCSKGCK